MNIIDATRLAMDRGLGITRPEFKKAVYLIPTNTIECYITIPVGFKFNPSLTLKKRKNSLYIAQWCRLQAVEI